MASGNFTCSAEIAVNKFHVQADVGSYPVIVDGGYYDLDAINNKSDFLIEDKNDEP